MRTAAAHKTMRSWTRSTIQLSYSLQVLQLHTDALYGKHTTPRGLEQPLFRQGQHFDWPHEALQQHGLAAECHVKKYQSHLQHGNAGDPFSAAHDVLRRKPGARGLVTSVQDRQAHPTWLCKAA